MPRIALAPQALDDVDHFLDHQAPNGIEDMLARIAQSVGAIQLLTHIPLLGRSTRSGQRELVTGQGTRGDVAPCRYVPTLDIVFIRAIRAQRGSQREGGYERHD